MRRYLIRRKKQIRHQEAWRRQGIAAEGDIVGALVLSEQVLKVGGEHSEIKLGEEGPCMAVLMQCTAQGFPSCTSWYSRPSCSVTADDRDDDLEEVQQCAG
jgi:hypothetical protein